MDTDLNTLATIEKSQRLKTKTLYKNGTRHTTRFWEKENIPIRTQEDERLLAKLIEEGSTKQTGR